MPFLFCPFCFKLILSSIGKTNSPHPATLMLESMLLENDCRRRLGWSEWMVGAPEPWILMRRGYLLLIGMFEYASSWTVVSERARVCRIFWLSAAQQIILPCRLAACKAAFWRSSRHVIYVVSDFGQFRGISDPTHDILRVVSTLCKISPLC